MARCRGLVSTAGFESIAEAMYLGKPVQVVPVEGHFEQWCNAFDTVRAGAGIRSKVFDLKCLQQHICHGSSDRGMVQRYVSPPPPRGRTSDAAVGLPTDRFRAWVTAGRDRFVREIEAAAREGAASCEGIIPFVHVGILVPRLRRRRSSLSHSSPFRAFSMPVEVDIRRASILGGVIRGLIRFVRRGIVVTITLALAVMFGLGYSTVYLPPSWFWWTSPLPSFSRM